MTAEHDGSGACDEAQLLARAADRVEREQLTVVRRPDTDRRLATVWAPPSTPSGRGRPARFTRDDVVEAGLAVVATTGLDGLSMRKVAQELGVGVMSLYTHVPGRTELIDLMLDRAYAELDLPDGTERTWREGVTRWAHAMIAMYTTHAWVADVNIWRLPLTPHVLDAQEAQLRALTASGAHPFRVARVADWLLAAVLGLGRSQATERLESQRTGQDQQAYWNSLAAYWEDYFQPARYPTMMRIWLSGAFDQDDRDATTVLERDIELLVDSVERELEAPSSEDSPAD